MNFTSAIRALPDLRKGHQTKPYNKKDAPAEKHGNWRKMSTSSKNTDTSLFYSSTEARAMPAPTSKSPDEREFVLDSKASMHMLSKQDLSSDELDTLRRSQNPTVVVTTDGEVQTKAHVHVHDLDLFVRVQVLQETHALHDVRSSVNIEPT